MGFHKFKYICIVLFLSCSAVYSDGNKLAITLGNPWAGIKYNISGRLSTELRSTVNPDISIVASRWYYNFIAGEKLNVFAGAEYGMINFNYDGVSGNGYSISPFIGSEYFLSSRLSLGIDLDYANIGLQTQAQDAAVSGPEYIYNLVLAYYIVGGKTAPAERVTNNRQEETSDDEKAGIEDKIKELELEKQRAVDEEDYARAGELKKEIEEITDSGESGEVVSTETENNNDISDNTTAGSENYFQYTLASDLTLGDIGSVNFGYSSTYSNISSATIVSYTAGANIQVGSGFNTTLTLGFTPEQTDTKGNSYDVGGGWQNDTFNFSGDYSNNYNSQLIQMSTPLQKIKVRNVWLNLGQEVYTLNSDINFYKDTSLTLDYASYNYDTDLLVLENTLESASVKVRIKKTTVTIPRFSNISNALSLVQGFPDKVVTYGLKQGLNLWGTLEAQDSHTTYNLNVADTDSYLIKWNFNIFSPFSAELDYNLTIQKNNPDLTLYTLGIKYNF